MQELDFILDGESALAHGIMLQKPISFAKVQPRMNTVQVVGKSGDLHIDLDAYENISGEASCYSLGENVGSIMADVMSFLFSTKGYRKLQTSDDILYYREAVVKDGGNISSRLALLNPYNIMFSCKPYRRLLSGDDAIFVNNGDTIINPCAFASEPLIFFSAIDAGTITIGDYTITIKSTLPDYMVSDSETWACYPENSSHTFGYNGDISIYQYPLLHPGETRISWTGGASVTKIIPRWRTL